MSMSEDMLLHSENILLNKTFCCSSKIGRKDGRYIVFFTEGDSCLESITIGCNSGEKTVKNYLSLYKNKPRCCGCTFDQILSRVAREEKAKFTTSAARRNT